MFTLGIFQQCLRNKSKAWHNLGFLKNNTKQRYSQQEICQATKDIQKYPKTHECYVPDNHNDFHAQIKCIFNDLCCIQAKKKGIKWVFSIDGKQSSTEY